MCSFGVQLCKKKKILLNKWNIFVFRCGRHFGIVAMYFPISLLRFPDENRFASVHSKQYQFVSVSKTKKKRRNEIRNIDVYVMLVENSMKVHQFTSFTIVNIFRCVFFFTSENWIYVAHEKEPQLPLTLPNKPQPKNERNNFFFCRIST